MKNQLLSNSLFFLVFLFGVNMWAQETKVMVRVKAKDAKFIGTSIGGAQVQIKNSKTGAVLAEGVTQGSTGNTDVIMKKSHDRWESITDEQTAGFLATLAIKEPTFVTIEAKGPVNAKQATAKSSTQIWVIPEKDILGDGIVLEIPGFIVDILSPQRHQSISENTPIEIKTNVIMMCGCTITPGGIWNADDYEVKAILKNEDGEKEILTMKYAGQQNTFSTEFKGKSGLYEISVFVFDAKTGNTGVDKTNIIIR